jgi:hypothetical protein
MELVNSYPGLLERLTAGEEEDIIHVGELVSLTCLKCIRSHLPIDGEGSIWCARRRH